MVKLFVKLWDNVDKTKWSLHSVRSHSNLHRLLTAFIIIVIIILVVMAVTACHLTQPPVHTKIAADHYHGNLRSWATWEVHVWVWLNSNVHFSMNVLIVVYQSPLMAHKQAKYTGLKHNFDVLVQILSFLIHCIWQLVTFHTTCSKVQLIYSNFYWPIECVGYLQVR